MSDEVYALALKNTIDEIKNAIPNMSNTFIFKEDGKIIAKDESTNEETINNAMSPFRAITKQADAIGGIEGITFHGTNGQVNITRINDFYLAITASKEADEKYVSTLTRVLIPTVLKLAEKIHSIFVNDDAFTKQEPEPLSYDDANETFDDAEDCRKELLLEETDATEPEPTEKQSDSEINPEPFLPEPPVNQFIVENLGGLPVPLIKNLSGSLVPSHTVRIDSTVIAQWKGLFADKNIEEVDVETLNGRTTRCKFKPIKDSKYDGKGVIQIPGKIQLTLQTRKGELVMVKPVVE